MKIATINDTHFGGRNDSAAFNEYFFKFYDEVFFPYLREHDIKTLVHLGDVVENPQLNSRQFWHSNFNKNLDITLKYPGAPFLSSEFEIKYYRSAPMLGEHNDEIKAKL